MMSDLLLTEIGLAYEGDEELDVDGQGTADSPSDMMSNHLLPKIGLAYKRDEELDANGLASGDSDPPDIMSDRLLTEVELAYKGDGKFDASGQATGVLNMATIAYEEALERELEYQKRMNVSSLLPPADSSFFSRSSRELGPNPSLTGVKRKEASGPLSDLVPEPMNRQKLLPNLLQDRLVPSPQFKFQQPPVQQLQHQQPLLRQSSARQSLQKIQQFSQPKPNISLNQQRQQHHSQKQQPVEQVQQYGQTQHHLLLNQQRQQQHAHRQKPFGQGQQYRRPQPHLSVNQRPLQHSQPPFWCNICKLNCESFANLKIHRHGRKHRAKLEEIHTGKTKISVHKNEMLWCQECNIPCMNEMALAQHRAGKKHMTTVALRANVGAPGAGMNMINNG